MCSIKKSLIKNRNFHIIEQYRTDDFRFALSVSKRNFRRNSNTSMPILKNVMKRIVFIRGNIFKRLTVIYECCFNIIWTRMVFYHIWCFFMIHSWEKIFWVLINIFIKPLKWWKSNVKIDFFFNLPLTTLYEY